jgi:hypothetical protein
MPKFDENGLQYRGCQDCYDYIPHLHPERLTLEYAEDHFKQTKGDEFIWAMSSGDITFMKKEWVQKGLEIISQFPDLTFFFQSKNPKCFQEYEFSGNCILGITLETNHSMGYELISKAPCPPKRFEDFCNVSHPRKSVTIEPILDFDLETLEEMIIRINPERVYVGYDTKKTGLPEPSLHKTKKLISDLRGMEFNVKEKYIPKKEREKGGK